MKAIKISYWVLTILTIAVMGLGAIPNIISNEQSVELFKTLQYPLYIMPFIGVCKLVASIIILIPGLKRLKEWAYAGMVIDLTGAMYSTIMIGEPFSAWVFFIVFLAIVLGSYFLYHKKEALAAA